MRRRTYYVIVGALLIAAAAGVYVWRTRTAQNAQEDVARAARAQRGPMVVAVTASGRIKPVTRVDLSFESPGRVTEVLVEEGDEVDAGQALARLKTDQLEVEVRQARAALSGAESQLAELEAGPTPEEIEQSEANLRAAEAQLAAAAANRNGIAQGPTDADIAAAEARVTQANTEKEIAQDSFDLIKEEGTEKEHANYDLYTAKQELAAAQAQIEDVLSGPDGAELRAAQSNVAAAAAQRDAAQAQLDQLLAGPSKEEIAEAEAQVSQAEVAVRIAEHALERATLRAPIAGIVTEINVTPGETPPTREAPMVLVDNTAFHITVGVDELDVSQLERGQEVEITVEALPDAEVGGTVGTISPVASQETGVVAYDVVIDLAPTEAPLRADMSANATIVIEELSDVLQIPNWAVRIDRATGDTYVQRRANGEIGRVDVELGVRHDGVVQVISGLSEGDEVVRLEAGASFGFES